MNPTKSLLLTLLLSTPLPVTGVPTAAQSTQPARLRILIVHGPNLNLLGRREPSVYGVTTLPQINGHLQKLAAELDVELVIIQSNHEGVIVDAFQQHMDDVAGAVINPAGLSFHSVALHDVIKAMPFPVVETHISNLGTRDEIHRHSIITPAVRASIMGLGWRSYTAGLRALVEIVREEKSKDVRVGAATNREAWTSYVRSATIAQGKNDGDR